MSMRRLISIYVVFILVSFSNVFGQEVLNSYKYVIVPAQYEFQSSADQYQINSLTKFLFEKKDFDVLLSTDAYPQELAANPCLALKAVLVKESGLFTTKVKINLVDCFNATVYSTKLGTSKIKEYQKAYHEAIRDAFDEILEFDYAYNGTVKNNLNNAVSPVAQTQVQQVNVVPVPQVTTAVVAETAVSPVAVQTVPAEVEETKVYTIEGTYFIDMWGECKIEPKGDGYAIVGGDENYEFATISKTSKSTMFMFKKTGFSQSQLLELTENGSLQIDTESGVKVFKRVE